MTVTETSKEAYERVMAHPDRDLAEVLAMIEELGPCHNNRILEALQQADKQRPRKKRRGCVWVSNNCWPRVTDLMMLRVVVNMGQYRGVWEGRNVSFNFRRVGGDGRPVPPGWVKVPPQFRSKLTRGSQEISDKLAMAASAAGRKLREFRRVKGRKVPEKTDQYVFNW